MFCLFDLIVVVLFGQEDLKAEDTVEIIDDLIAGRTPKPGPRYGHTVTC